MSNIKENWDLTLLYKNEKDPQIEKDLKEIEKSYTAFAKKYKGKDFISNPKILLQALQDREELRKIADSSKPWWYMALRTSIDTGDAVAGAESTKFSQRITKAENLLAFFSLEIAKISKKNQVLFLKDPLLKDFKYSLQRTFKRSSYNLSEPEEQIINLLSQTSYDMWKNSFSKVIGQATLEYKGSHIPFPKAIGILSDQSKKDREELYKKIVEVQKLNSSFAESEINALYNYKKIIDEKRGFPEPYSSTILSYENDSKTVLNLIDLVTKNFKISHRFFKIHARLLKEKKITMADRAAKIGEITKKFDFKSSIQIVKAAFTKIDPKYADLLDSYLSHGQIDVYPTKGKRGGAFCWGRGQLPTFVLLNHADNINSVETLAHEMGHAIHTELTKALPPRYSHYSMSTAEVASTFFEQATTAEIEKQLTEKENLILLHNKILGDIATIFRQVACFNFELELHKQIREKGEISNGDMATLMSKHLKSYVGDAVEVTQDDGYQFVSWGHIRNFFYVYSYAYGLLISRALYENWEKDKSYSKKIEQFLSAGRSMSPEDIFKKIGINVTDPSFFESGLKSIEKDILKLERLEQRIHKA